MTRCPTPTGPATAGRRRRPRQSASSCAACSRCPLPTRPCWWTRTCARRASRARWSAASPPAARTTRGGAAPGERQPLLRDEFAVGAAALGAEFIALADQFRYPVGGLDEPTVREIRRIKARMEAERIPRGTDRALHLKLGPGGLSDVEWTVQLLQLRHGDAIEGLRTTRTIEALDAAVAAGLATHPDADALAAAWRFGSRIRNAIMLVRGRPGDALPAKHDELTAVARLLGYKPSAAAADIRANPVSAWSDTPAQALEGNTRQP